MSVALIVEMKDKGVVGYGTQNAFRCAKVLFSESDKREGYQVL